MIRKKFKLSTQIDVKKLKKSIKIEYLIVIIISVLILIFLIFSEGGLGSSSKKNASYESYSITLEKNLEMLLSEVNGAGKIKVMVTVDGSEEQVYLKNSETIIENGVKTVKESIVLIGGKPYLVKTNNPNIVGVIVVCEGGDNLSVKVNLVEIITTTLSVNADCVRIIKMK